MVRPEWPYLSSGLGPSALIESHTTFITVHCIKKYEKEGAHNVFELVKRPVTVTDEG